MVGMPLSASCLSLISACQFKKCWSLKESQLSKSGKPALTAFKYWLAVESKALKIFSTLHTCSFFLKPFLESCFSTPALLLSSSSCPTCLSMHLTLKVPVHCSGTLKKVNCLSPLQGNVRLLQAGFLLLCHFHMNLNIQNSWPHWSFTSGKQYLQSLWWEGINKSVSYILLCCSESTGKMATDHLFYTGQTYQVL